MNDWDVRNMTSVWYDTPGGSLQCWDLPMADVRYVIGADSAEGKRRDIGPKRAGQDFMRDRPDYSAAVVLELESGKHVATWHGDSPPSEWASSLVALAREYNMALLIPETNGPGVAVIDQLVKVYKWPNLYRKKILGREVIQDWETGEYGWTTSRTTRPLLIQRVHEWLNGPPKSRDPGLARELRTMEIDDQGTARARGKNKDDRVLALALALQARYELLYSRLTDDYQGQSTQDEFTRKVWEKAKRFMRNSKKRNEQRNNPRDGTRPGALPRPVRRR